MVKKPEQALGNLIYASRGVSDENKPLTGLLR